MSINKTCKNSYFPVKHTTQEHQVQMFLSHIFVRPGGPSKDPFSESLNNLEYNYISSYFKFVLIHSCDIPTGFVSLLRNFPLKRNVPFKKKIPPHFSRNMWTICVFQHFYCKLQYALLYVTSEFYFLIESRFCTFDQKFWKGFTIS